MGCGCWLCWCGSWVDNWFGWRWRRRCLVVGLMCLLVWCWSLFCWWNLLLLWNICSGIVVIGWLLCLVWWLVFVGVGVWLVIGLLGWLDSWIWWSWLVVLWIVGFISCRIWLRLCIIIVWLFVVFRYWVDSGCLVWLEGILVGIGRSWKVLLFGV